MIPTLPWQTPTLSLRVPCTSDPLFHRDVGISVGFFTETTGSLHNPKTRRTASYVHICISFYMYNLIILQWTITILPISISVFCLPSLCFIFDRKRVNTSYEISTYPCIHSPWYLQKLF